MTHETAAKLVAIAWKIDDRDEYVTAELLVELIRAFPGPDWGQLILDSGETAYPTSGAVYRRVMAMLDE